MRHPGLEQQVNVVGDPRHLVSNFRMIVCCMLLEQAVRMVPVALQKRFQ